MRAFIVAATLVFVSASVVGAAVQTAQAQTAGKYTTADTDIGTLLDDPAARAILDKYIPDVSKSDQIGMARSMTLKSLQQYSPDSLTDETLAVIDADLAKLAEKK